MQQNILLHSGMITSNILVQTQFFGCLKMSQFWTFKCILLNNFKHFLEAYSLSNISTLKCSQLISSSDNKKIFNKKILLSTRNVWLDIQAAIQQNTIPNVLKSWWKIWRDETSVVMRLDAKTGLLWRQLLNQSARTSSTPPPTIGWNNF